MSVYTYTVSTDFPNGEVNIGNLAQEIRDSNITIALSGITLENDTVTITFKDTLPAAGKTILDGDTTNPAGGLIAAHDSTPIDPQPEPVSIQNLFTDGDNRLEVAPVPPVGLTERTLVSHNFCDPCTWYTESARTIETAVDSGDGFTFNLTNPNVIDMYHGRTYDEYHVRRAEPHEYAVVVRVNGVEQTMREAFTSSGGDYEVNYESGRIIFFQNQSGNTVEVEYSYAQGSSWWLIPSPGHRCDIQYSEAQFSSDLEMESSIAVVLEGFVEAFAPSQAVSNGGPVPNGTQIELDRWPYQTIDNIIEEAVTAQPRIASIGTNARASTERQVFPFQYSASQAIRASLGMRIGTQLGSDTPWSGTRASITFYCLERPEPAL